MFYKIENNILIEAPLNFKTPDGKTICNFNKSQILMNQYGFTVTEEEAETWKNEHQSEEPEKVILPITKYQLIKALKQHNQVFFDDLVNAYNFDSDLRFYWNSVNELDIHDQIFRQFAVKFNLSDEDIEELFILAEGL